MLKVKSISKNFPGVKALDNISINFNAGEVHGLLGENGAGKSTLIKILTGLQKQDEGEMFLNGKVYKPKNPFEVLKKGIHAVYQEVQIIPQASVAENIMLDKLPTKGRLGFVDWRKIIKISKKYLDIVGLDLDPKTIIGKISVAQKQLVEIAKALASKTKILLLDEPTSSLTEKEVDSLFEIIVKLKEEGVLIIFVTHHLDEVFKICDKVSVLRDGKHVITDDIKKLNKKKIVKFMIGREENIKPLGVFNADKSKKVLEVSHLTRMEKANDISFSLYKGEILGFYGLVGSGRTELAKIIIGIDRYDSGEVFVNSRKARIENVSTAFKKYKIGYVTEDREKEGLIFSHNIKSNICITIWERITNKMKLISNKKEIDRTQEQVDNLDIKITGLGQKVGTLSGGNKQKVNIAKWLTSDVDILIFDEPTIGVDIGVREYINRLIWDLSNRGKSIILISSDMTEMIRLASRVLVFHKNKIVGEIDNDIRNYDEISSKIMNFITMVE